MNQPHVSPSGVTVRMYRQGLGDCFLLSFGTGKQGKPYHVLIDCGVLQSTPDARQTMNRVVADIARATDGHIELLVVTHEHWDHVSGFLQAREIFESVQIHNVWLAWTEDPSDRLARDLRRVTDRDRAALRQGLALARSQMGVLPAWTGLLSFFGETFPGQTPAGPQGPEALGLAGRGTQAALQTVRAYAEQSGGQVQYLTPGTCRVLPPLGAANVPAAQVYVLGPPHDSAALRELRPGAGDSYDDEGLNARTAFIAALTEPGATDQSEDERLLRFFSRPFDDDVTLSFHDAKGSPFFLPYYASENAWRNIEDSWLSPAGELALQLDNRTNNTSLVLAFELARAGNVLLFVGDAQLGNWSSWSKLQFQSPGGQAVKVRDLLARTVLYKVGHHGSANATAREAGLELMTHPDLVAMLPVSAALAQSQRPPWKMPFASLLSRLQERTAHRVLRADTGLSAPPPNSAAAAHWDAFAARTTVTDLYVEYVVDD